MTVEREFWVPGELLDVIFESQGSFVNDVATFKIKEGSEEDKFLKFTGVAGYLSLVNNENSLAKDFAPGDLVDVNTLNSMVLMVAIRSCVKRQPMH